MTTPDVEQRVATLEDLMAELIRSGIRVDRQIERTQRQVDKTSRELAAFKVEMGDFKTEMQAFKTEMQAFKIEMQEFREEMRADRKEMRRQWGELANRLGTMTEDLVAPSVPRVMREVLGTGDAPIDSAVRVRRHLPQAPGAQREFDVVATCGDHMLIAETKSRLAAEDATRFAASLPAVRDFLPEHADKRIVGAIASLYVDPPVATHAESLGLIVLGFGDDVMQVLNTPAFQPRTF